MSRVESPFAELPLGVHFENVISEVSSPEAPPLLGGYDNHRKQAGNRPSHATLPPSRHPPNVRLESRSAPWPLSIASDSTASFVTKFICSRAAICAIRCAQYSRSFRSLLGGQNQASNLQSSHHGRRDSDFSRSIRACRNTPYDKRGTPLSVVGLARTVDRVPADRRRHNPVITVGEGWEKYR